MLKEHIQAVAGCERNFDTALQPFGQTDDPCILRYVPLELLVDIAFAASPVLRGTLQCFLILGGGGDKPQRREYVGPARIGEYLVKLCINPRPLLAWS